MQIISYYYEKKNYSFISFMLLVCICVCRFIRKPGYIVLRPINIIGSNPTITPFSDPLETFELYASDDVLVLGSNLASGEVTVTIAGVNGVVYTTTETMSVGSELTISVSSLPAGAYTTYIYYANTVYVGQFEI